MLANSLASFSQILQPYQVLIENQMINYVEALKPENGLKDACKYALLNGGKRFRPSLVIMIAKGLGYGANVLPAALGVEFFHTASLIADDLPCMDDDDERRNKPTLHKVYGESIALLSTYALIAAGYECLAKNAGVIKQSGLPFSDKGDQICVLALENASYNTGIFGATGGQLMDIEPPDLSLITIKETLRKKTVTLFEISFVFGWLFGGGDMSCLPLVKQGADHFGLAFQIADDIGDMEQDLANKRLINLANVCGKERAQQMFHEEITHFLQVLKKLNLQSEEILALVDRLVYQVDKGTNHL